VKGETTPDAGSLAPSGLSAVGALVRRHDPDRYRTALFAPSGRREALFALYAFNYEVARVRDSVTTPILGQIRLQWWREALDAAYAGTAPRRHEVAEPLTAAIRAYGLTRRRFDRLIDAREADLADQPPATLAALEDYAGATSASLIRLAIEILGNSADGAAAAADEVGIGYALVGLLRALPLHARAGRRYIPAEVAIQTGLDPADYTGMRPSPALRRAVEALGAAAAARLDRARQRRREVPPAALPALLPAVIAERALVRLRRAGWNPFDPSVAAPDPLLVWRLGAARLLRRF
jgi:phytoene synthase